MPCTAPNPAWRPSGAGGRPRIGEPPPGDSADVFRLDCGQCLSCRIARQRDWAIRSVHETQMAGEDFSSFLTLTYNPTHLPENGALCRADLRNFLKRFRKRHGRGIRYLAAGEYGDVGLRPHYHLAFWGHRFADRTPWKRTKQGHTLYRSKALERAWSCPDCKEPIGHAWLGSLTFESAAYVAGYVTKKLTGPLSWEAHLRLTEDGKLVSVPEEFAVMSRGRRSDGQGGIGYRFYRRYFSDLFPSDFVHLKKQNGTVRKYPVPRYYRKLLEQENPTLAEDLKARRKAAALSRCVEDSPDLRRARDATIRGERALFGHPDDRSRVDGAVRDVLAGHLRVKRYLDDQGVIPEWSDQHEQSD